MCLQRRVGVSAAAWNAASSGGRMLVPPPGLIVAIWAWARLTSVGPLQPRRRHDPLEGRVERDHAERVLGLQQPGGLDRGFAGHRQLGGAPGASRRPESTSMLPERSMTRNSARLPCCGSIGGSADTGSRSSSTVPW